MKTKLTIGSVITLALVVFIACCTSCSEKVLTASDFAGLHAWHVIRCGTFTSWEARLYPTVGTLRLRPTIRFRMGHLRPQFKAVCCSVRKWNYRSCDLRPHQVPVQTRQSISSSGDAKSGV